MKKSTYLIYTQALFIILISLGCTKNKQEDQPFNPEILNQIIEESKNIKKVSNSEYIKNIKTDLPKLIKNVDRCIELSKKHETKMISGADLKEVKTLALRVDSYNEKYCLERSEENPMLTFDINNQLEKDWVSVVSLAHNVCLDFSSYLPKTKNAKSFSQSYQIIYTSRYRHFKKSLDNFIKQYSI